MAERFYGKFGAKIRSLEGKVNLNVNGEGRQCTIIGLMKEKFWVSTKTVVPYFYVDFDYAIIWRPKIGAEFKQWELQVNTTEYDGNPAFRIYVDPQCASLSYNDLNELNYGLFVYLWKDHKMLRYIVEMMKDYFMSWFTEPYAKYKLMDSNRL